MVHTDTFTYAPGTKLFFGTVKWTGTGNYTELPAKCGQDMLLVHVPGKTYKIGPNADYSKPIPLLLDQNGRFGFVVPDGVNAIYVKMYGTLWHRVAFNGVSTNEDEETLWNGTVADFDAKLHLRYGDVNEDNKIIRTVNDPDRDRDYLNERVGGLISMTATGANSIFKYDYVCDLNRDNKVDDQLGDGAFFRDFLEPTNNLDGANLP